MPLKAADRAEKIKIRCEYHNGFVNFIQHSGLFFLI